MIYDPEQFKNTKDCAICMGEFDEHAEVTPLPCNIKHYFHTDCIAQWLKTRPECPICRGQLTASQMIEFGSKVEILLKEEAAHADS